MGACARGVTPAVWVRPREMLASASRGRLFMAIGVAEAAEEKRNGKVHAR